ncbi:MAG: radical SAM protein [Bacteroidota bacterium]|nr:radical SAM protein [Bacteroidota bacterium]
MTLRTAANLLSCLTARRVSNTVRALAACIRAERSGTAAVAGKPHTVTIEPTNLCNLHCPECPSGSGALRRREGYMDYDAFVEIVDEIAPDVVAVQLFFQGEPFLHPRIEDMISYAHRKRLFVSVSTNAHFIDEDNAERILRAGVDKLIVSLDGATEESYRSYRVGGNFSRVIGALKALHRCRCAGIGKRCELVVQCLVTRGNEPEIPRMRALARRYGAALTLKTIQVHSLEGAQRFLPRNDRYSRYVMHGDSFRPKSPLKNRCRRLWTHGVITWDGTAVPCCFDKDAAFPLGTVTGNSYWAVWSSAPYMEFRNAVLRNRRSITMCTNCTEGLRVYPRGK